MYSVTAVRYLTKTTRQRTYQPRMENQPTIIRRLCFQTVTKLLPTSSCCHATIHVSPAGDLRLGMEW